MVDWNRVRRDFPIAERYTYLDHASCGPMPKPAYERFLQFFQELSGYADFSWSRWLKRREEVRRKVANLMNAEPDEIAFTGSTSHGMNTIAELIARKGTVLTNTLEFPATTVPWIHRKARLKFLRPTGGELPVSEIKKNLTPSVKTILTSYVQYGNGFRQDLEALGNIKRGRFLVVNATQGFGYLPIDVKRARVDFLATNCYKWMMSGYGSGLLYVNKRWLRRFAPEWAGWRSVRDPERYDNRHVPLKRTAARYELGCPAFPQIFSVGAVIDYFSEIGFTNVRKRIFSLADFLIEQLNANGFRILSPTERKHRSGIVIFKVKNTQDVTNQLLKKRIYVSARGGGIRVAPHVYNTEREIRHLIRNVKEMSSMR